MFDRAEGVFSPHPEAEGAKEAATRPTDDQCSRYKKISGKDTRGGIGGRGAAVILESFRFL